MLNAPDRGVIRGWLVISVCIVLLACVTVLHQVKTLGLPYLESTQLQRHQAVLDNTAPTPWQYRILPELIVSGVLQLFSSAGVKRPVAAGFVALRLVQNLAIFSMAALYYSRVGLGRREVVLAMALLAWSMSHALNDSDLAINNYFDVLFYLVAGWLVVSEKPLWILPLTAIAALNRETSALLPLLVLSPLILSPASISRLQRRTLSISFCGCVIFIIIFLGLRRYYGYRETWPWPELGWPTLQQNLGDLRTLILLSLTFNVLPILTVWQLPRLPAVLRGFFWIVVPLWIVIHLVAALANETRLFLVPIALVLVPASVYRGDDFHHHGSDQLA